MMCGYEKIVRVFGVYQSCSYESFAHIYMRLYLRTYRGYLRFVCGGIFFYCNYGIRAADEYPAVTNDCSEHIVLIFQRIPDIL